VVGNSPIKHGNSISVFYFYLQLTVFFQLLTKILKYTILICHSKFLVFEKMNNFKKIQQDNAGQSTLEMALILPVLLFSLFAIVNIGLYMYAQLEVAFATHQAVRIGALTNENSKIRGVANNSLQNLQDHLTRTNIKIEPLNEATRSRGDDLKITITYSYPMPVKFKFPFGIVNPFFNRDSLPVKSIAIAQIEHE